MHGKLLLLLAIALVLLWIPRTREHLEPTATILAPDQQALIQGRPPYPDAEMTRIGTLVPGALNEYVALYKQSKPTATTAEAEDSGRLRFARQIASFYNDFYAPSLEPVNPTKVTESVERNIAQGITSQYKDIFVRVVQAYFSPTGIASSTTESTQTGAPAVSGQWSTTLGTSTSTEATAGTGPSGTSGTTGTTGSTGTTTNTIKAPNTNAGPLEAPYDAAEMDRIYTLSPTAKTQALSLLVDQPESNREPLTKLYLANIVAQFYIQVYSTTTRPIQDADIDAFIPTIRDRSPEQDVGLKELLQRYFMGAAAAQGPSLQQPKSYAELNTEYQAKVAEYQTKVAAALASNDATALPAIRALNEAITKLLEDMLASLDPLRQDTTTTRRQREELAAVLAQLERDYAGLKDTSDSMGRLRRIREMQKGATENDLKLYGVLFAAACLAVFVIAMSKS